MKTTHTKKFYGVFFSMLELLGAACNPSDNDVPQGERPGFAPEVSFRGLTSDNRIAMYEATDLKKPMDLRSITGLPK